MCKLTYSVYNMVDIYSCSENQDHCQNHILLLWLNSRCEITTIGDMRGPFQNQEATS